jgi:hypothetical protein
MSGGPVERYSADNPFSTRHVRPGAVPFFFSPGESIQSLLDRLHSAQGWGEIVGPHGSGKSTLLCALLAALDADGQRSLLLRVTSGERRLPAEARRIRELPAGATLAVDGFEQLSRFRRCLLRRACRSRDLGLIVTTHESAGLPRLATLAPTLETAQRIVAALTAGRESPIADLEVAASFAAAGGNLRETLFALYDLYERRR